MMHVMMLPVLALLVGAPMTSYIVVNAKGHCDTSVTVLIEELPMAACTPLKSLAFTSDDEEWLWVGCFDHFPTLDEVLFSLETGRVVVQMPPRPPCVIQSSTP